MRKFWFITSAIFVALVMPGCAGPTHVDEPSPSRSGPKLTFAAPLNRDLKDAVGKVPHGQAASIGSIVVCLDRPGRVRLHDASLFGDKGLSVTDVAARISPGIQGGDFLGDGHGSLRANRFAGTRTISGSCSNREQHYELAVQLQLTGRTVGITQGFKVHYTTNGRNDGSLRIPYAVTLCTADIASKPCQP